MFVELDMWCHLKVSSEIDQNVWLKRFSEHFDATFIQKL